MTRDDRSIRVLLGTIAILLGLNLLVQISGLTNPRTAIAAIPDTGAQMKAIVDNTAENNKKMDKLISYLESGNLSVKVKEMPAIEVKNK